MKFSISAFTEKLYLLHSMLSAFVSFEFLWVIVSRVVSDKRQENNKNLKSLDEQKSQRNTFC
jgi:hypothetical protein